VDLRWIPVYAFAFIKQSNIECVGVMLAFQVMLYVPLRATEVLGDSDTVLEGYGGSSQVLDWRD
jgi:hypothetical protein